VFKNRRQLMFKMTNSAIRSLNGSGAGTPVLLKKPPIASLDYEYARRGHTTRALIAGDENKGGKAH
jgi:hypothetical protein